MLDQKLNSQVNLALRSLNIDDVHFALYVALESLENDRSKDGTVDPDKLISRADKIFKWIHSVRSESNSEESNTELLKS